MQNTNIKVAIPLPIRDQKQTFVNPKLFVITTSEKSVNFSLNCLNMHFPELRKLSFIFFLGILMAGCQKKNDNSVPESPKTKTDLISSSSWKFSKAGIDQDNNGTIDYDLPAGLLQPCESDNILTFKSDKTGLADEGATKCDPTSPQSTPFTWSFGSNETELDFSNTIFAGISGNAKIIELSADKFILSKQVTVSGFSFPGIVILVH